MAGVTGRTLCTKLLTANRRKSDAQSLYSRQLPFDFGSRKNGSDAYQEALTALGNGAVSDIRIV